jgi:hypothetical protein
VAALEAAKRQWRGGADDVLCFLDECSRKTHWAALGLANCTRRIGDGVGRLRQCMPSGARCANCAWRLSKAARATIWLATSYTRKRESSFLGQVSL